MRQVFRLRVPQEKVPDAGFNSGLDDDVSEVKPAEAEFSSPTKPDSNGLIMQSVSD